MADYIDYRLHTEERRMNLAEQLWFEKDAYAGKQMPSGLKLSEQKAYLALRSLYADFRKGVIDKETGTTERLVIVFQLDNESQGDKLGEQIGKMWARIEQPSREYTLNPCIETADRFVAAVYGLPEDWRKDKVTKEGGFN